MACALSGRDIAPASRFVRKIRHKSADPHPKGNRRRRRSLLRLPFGNAEERPGIVTARLVGRIQNKGSAVRPSCAETGLFGSASIRAIEAVSRRIGSFQALSFDIAAY